LASLGLDGRKGTKIKAQAAAKAASEGDSGLSLKDIQRIGARIPPDSSSMIVFIEHLWGNKLEEIISKHGGMISNQAIISEGMLHKLEMRLKCAKSSQTAF
jgi:uncharacterized membrane protein